MSQSSRVLVVDGTPGVVKAGHDQVGQQEQLRPSISGSEFDDRSGSLARGQVSRSLTSTGIWMQRPSD